jgi:spermidine synthase
MKISKLLPIALLFILSGLTSLVYEVLWIRVIALGVGSTSASMSLVLSIFFFGLSLGSFFAGKYIEKINRPLVFYGVIEGLIGLYSFFLIKGLLNFQTILSTVCDLLSVTPDSAFFLMIKFGLVFLFLLPPTLGMGASLPILVQLFSRRELQSNKKNTGKIISLLYGINTFGAAIGAFISGFHLIPLWGISKANTAMAIVNFAIMVAAVIIHQLILAKETTENENENEDLQKTLSPEEKTISIKVKMPTQSKAILIACGASGMASLTAQVVWNKYLGVFFGTNIYGLGLILAIYLFGMAIGSFILAVFIDRLKNKYRFLTQLIVVNVLSVMATSYLLDELAYIAFFVSKMFNFELGQLTVKAIAATMILTLPTIIFGSLLPLAISTLTVDGKKASWQVGLAYSINTCGSILGSYITGIIILPLWGSAAAILMAVLFLIVSLVVMIVWGLREDGPSSFWQSLKLNKNYSAVTVVLVLIMLFAPSVRFHQVIKAAYFNYRHSFASFADVKKALSKENEDFKMIREGETAIISLSNDKNDGQNYQEILRLKTNGLNESVYFQNALEVLPKYEALLGLLPYLFSDRPQKAYIVGYGGGYTVDLLTNLQIPMVHVVELEKGILEAADYVYQGANPVLRRKNLKLEIEDARYSLNSMQDQQYDFVVSQPSHSWLTGVANLFTIDFFKIVKNNLNQKGIFAQWLNLYNMDETVLKSILKSFYEVFPHGAVFTDSVDDELIMLGSSSPLQFNHEQFEKLKRGQRWKNVLQMVPIESKEGFFSNFAFTREDVWPLIESAVINTDDNAYAEVRQSKLYYNNEAQQGVDNFFHVSFKGNFGTLLGPLKEDKVALDSFNKNIINHYLSYQKTEKLYQKFAHFERQKQAEEDYQYLGETTKNLERYHSALYYFNLAMKKNPDTYSLNSMLQIHLISKNWIEAQKLLAETTASLKDDTTFCYETLINLNIDPKSADKINENDLLSRAAKLKNDCGPYFDLLLGQYYLELGEYEKAINSLAQNFQSSYLLAEALRLSTIAQLKMNRLVESQSMINQLSELTATESTRILDLAAYYRLSNLENDALFLEEFSRQFKVQ